MLIKNKKGVDFITSTIMFIVLNLIFFIILFAFVSKTASDESFYEKKYSREIALIIDSSNKGDVISVNINDIKIFIEKNKLDLNEVFLIKDNYVVVNLNKNEGHLFKFLSDNKVTFSNHIENNEIYLDIEIS